ncbi:MAG: LacI family transcriptional regulator [Defluviitaleaceae bacterium]|nr:LacI family transcriptional regulator [Defluviitaleaceae bacterium]
MATIKDISKATGFSTTTISLILSGKAQEGRVSQKTRETVLDAAQELGYRVNVAARRLKANQGSKLMVSVFMALDTRAYGMMRFLLGLQAAVEKCEQEIELVVHSYKSGTLHTQLEAISLTGGAIICNASEEDLRFIEEQHIPVPIVLCLRNSEKYFTVNVNHSHIGEMAAGIFARRGHKIALVIDSIKYFSGMNYWTGQFTKMATHYGMNVTETHVNNETRGGYKGGLTLCKMQPMPDCVFTVSNAIAIGVLRACGEHGIEIPKQLELISIGIDIADFEEFTNVSVSTIFVPMEQMAEEGLCLLLLQINDSAAKPFNMELPITYKPRESCGN